MWCLWNGEYGEHDLSYVPNIDLAIRNQEEQYKNYIGAVVGDFTCINVEYDWGNRGQRWTLKCNLCGKESYKKNAKDWYKRAHGRSLYCDCRKSKTNNQYAKIDRIEVQKKDQQEKMVNVLWESKNGWTVMNYDGGSSCYVVCDKCNYGKTVKVKDFLQGKILPCIHKRPTDYSGNEWIGKRNGHLTAIGRDGSMFVCRCDCGETINVRPVELFTRKTKRACGGANCEYSSVVWKEAQKRKRSGIAYEKEVEQMLLNKGYNAKATKSVGDYGVDIIITNDDGTTTAVQCKKQTSPAGVSAVQEAYAGGRFYDCTRFAVVCDAGFSDQAYYMAKKLGVYLCNGDFDYPKDIEKYANELLPTFKLTEKNKKYYEINGTKKTLSDWCVAYGIDLHIVRRRIKDGMSLELALTTPAKTPKTYTINGFTGTLTEVCKHFNMRQQTVKYRMDHRNMSLEEALFTPKSNEI